MIGFIELLSSFGKDVATSVGSEVLTQLAKALRKRAPSILSVIQVERLYLRRVAKDVEKMPVIYRGIELSTRADYVEASLNQLDHAVDSLRSSRPSPEANKLRDHHINQARRIVWLGEAGIGKTTLLRKVVLEIASKQFTEESLVKQAGLVPVYVPLKAVSVSHPAPVLNYILNSIDYFRGYWGERRLLSLALNRRLAIFLDGYDEIPYLDKSRLIERELGVLLSNDFFIDTRLSPSHKYGQIHRAMQKCRIWMTSRKEFFFAHEVSLSEARCFEVRGLPSNGDELVRKILAYYQKKIVREGGKQLDEAAFLSSLSAGIKVGLEDLSNNPLFLTILAYSTFEAMRSGDDVTKVWRHGPRGIISACTNQLLLEMDKEKFEPLSVIDRSRLVSNRGRWAHQKLLIVRRIAWCGYERGIAIYSLSDIEDATREFLSEAKGMQDRNEILEGVGSDDFSVNIAAQICYSGVLVGILNSERKVVYDFIHRRFRESLAAQCVLEDVGVERLCDSVDFPSMSELVLVVAREEGRWYQLALAVMDKIFALDKDRQQHWHVSVLLAGLFQVPADQYDKRSLFGQLIEKCLSRGVYPVLDRRLLTFLTRERGSTPFRDAILQAIDVAAQQGDSAKIGFCLPILQTVDPGQHDGRIEKLLDGCDKSDEFARTVMSFAEKSAARYRSAVERFLARAFEGGFSRNDPVTLAAINTFLKKTGVASMTQWDLEGVISELRSPASVALARSIRTFQGQVNTLPNDEEKDERKGTARNRLLVSRFPESSNWRDAAAT